MKTAFITVIPILALLGGSLTAAEIGNGPVNSVVEISFTGPAQTPSSTPSRDIEFWARIQHESGAPTYKVQGFWDGNGAGGTTGNVFKVRFCPTSAGKWNLIEVHSGAAELNGEKQGDFVTAAASALHGFWMADPASPGSRWFMRSDGSHQYVFGNTHYSFLSEQKNTGPNGSNIAADVTANAAYFKKLRFSVHGDRYPHPTAKAFFDNSGNPTDSGDFSCRPNPAWFHQRVDLAVNTAAGLDLIADLILNGPDAVNSRSILKAAGNGGDATPYLRYIAARYGSYPNVWICLANEWDIKTPSYTAAEIIAAANIIKPLLPYPTPLSVHGNAGDWNTALNTTPAWHRHVIVQTKIKDLSDSADQIDQNHGLGGGDKPVVDDELGYEGAGDSFSEADIVEGHLGAFLGGGYGSTGYKPAAKVGQYFWGAFNPAEHTAVDNLGWLSQRIDADVSFWKMAPVSLGSSIFTNTDGGFRAMQWAGNEYVLGTDAAKTGVIANLPAGTWRVKRYDAITKTETTLSTTASGAYTFDAPNSRAVLFQFQKTAGAGNQPPNASITPDKTFGLPGSVVTFTPTASDPDGVIASHVWHWGNADEPLSGAPATKTHSWASVGEYAVTLGVTDNGVPPLTATSGAVTITVTNNLPPVITSASATPVDGLAPMFVTFTATASDPAGDPLTYEWDFTGDGIYDATGSTATFTYTATGHVDPVLRVSDGVNAVTQTLSVDVGSPDPGPAPVTVDFGSEADTYIYQTNPATNYGTTTEMTVGGGTTRRDAFIRFNVSNLPAGATVTSAKLLLVCSNSSGDVAGGGAIRKFSPSVEQWVETQPTWNSPLAGSDASGDLATLGQVVIGTTYEFTNLHSAVTGNGRVTFVIRSAAQDGAAYRTKEHTVASQRPILRVTYVKTPFQSWRESHFNTTQLADSAISGPDADPDQDGISNLLEYALALNPLASDTKGLPTVGTFGDHLSLTRRKDKTATDILYAPQAGETLAGDWNAAGITESIVADDGILQSIMAVDPATISGNKKRFMRLNVTLKP